MRPSGSRSGTSVVRLIAAICVLRAAATMSAIARPPGAGWVTAGAIDPPLGSGDRRELRATLTAHKAGVAALAFGHGHGLLASASGDRTVRLWDLRTNAAVRTIETPEGSVPRAVAWSESGKTLCVGATDGALRFYDAETGHERCVLRAHQNAVSKVRVLGGRLASTGADQSARFYDAREIDRGVPPVALGAASGHGTVFGASFSPQGDRAATVRESTLHVWRLSRLATQERLGVHQGGVESVAFDKSGAVVASGATDWSVRLWNAATGECERVLSGHTAAVASVVFDKAGARLATGGWDGSARIWDVASGRELSSFRSGSDRVLFVRFSPDERLLATANGDGGVRIYDVEQSRLALQIRAHASECRCLAFSPDGAVLASSSYQDRVIRLFRVDGGTLVKELAGHGSGVAGIEFSPNGRALVSTGFDRSVRVWDVASGSFRVLGEHDARGFKVSFDQRGDRIVSASGDRSVRIWQKDGNVRRLRGHQGDVNQAAFSSDGERIVSGGDDMTVRIWRTHDGRALWRTVVLLGPAHDLLTHRGWRRLSERHRPRALSPELEARLQDDARFAVSEDGGEHVALVDRCGRHRAGALRRSARARLRERLHRSRTRGRYAAASASVRGHAGERGRALALRPDAHARSGLCERHDRDLEPRHRDPPAPRADPRSDRGVAARRRAAHRGV